MLHVVLVAVGGGLGAAFRHLANLAAIRWLGAGFPWGTAFVNVFGSFLMGLFIGVLARRFGVSNEIRLLIATGFLGGFTTFSSFSLDTVTLYERGALGLAAVYVAASVLLGLAALFGGLSLARLVG